MLFAPAVVLSDETVGRLGIEKRRSDRREFPGDALTVGVPLDDAEEFLKTLVHAHFLSVEEAGELSAAILAQKGATVGDRAPWRPRHPWHPPADAWLHHLHSPR